MSPAGESAPLADVQAAEVQAGAVKRGAAQAGSEDVTVAEPAAAKQGKGPLYPRLLRLRHIAPSAWQRAVFGEGSFLVAALLVMADVASAWTLAAVPLGVAAVVKFNDVLVGALDHHNRARDLPENTFGA